MTEDPDPRADHGVSPTVRLWQLAESLREHRERAGLTIEQAAERLKPRSPRWSRSKVQRIETRLYAPQPSEVEHLTAVYELPAGDAAALVAMAREARQKGWWTTSDLTGSPCRPWSALSRQPPPSGSSSWPCCPACCRPRSTPER